MSIIDETSCSTCRHYTERSHGTHVCACPSLNQAIQLHDRDTDDLAASRSVTAEFKPPQPFWCSAFERAEAKTEKPEAFGYFSTWAFTDDLALPMPVVGQDVMFRGKRIGRVVKVTPIHVTIAISDRDTFTAATVYLETKLQKLMQ